MEQKRMVGEADAESSKLFSCCCSQIVSIPDGDGMINGYDRLSPIYRAPRMTHGHLCPCGLIEQVAETKTKAQVAIPKE